METAIVYRMGKLACGVVLAMVLLSVPALSQERETGLKKIGILERFNGGVTLKNNGLWAVPLKSGMTLYHGDKIVTDAEGFCRVVFHDDAVLDVRPNSSIRLAEIKKYDGSFLRRERHLRLFVGKLRYRSGEGSMVHTKLVSPTAVAVLRGSEAEFGTDGVLAMLHQMEGESSVIGDVTRTDGVPDATAELAAENPDYKASKAADQVREQYLRAVRSLVTSSLETETRHLMAAGGMDPLLLMQLVAQTREDPEAMADKTTADQVLILAALYVLADANALKVENRMLLDNPDPDHRQRAQQALDHAAETLERARSSLQSARETARKIGELIQRILEGSPEQIEQALVEVKPVIREMIRSQRQNVRQALGRELITNLLTAGVDEDMLEIPEFWPLPERALHEQDEVEYIEDVVDIVEEEDYDEYIDEDEDLYEDYEEFQEDKEKERREREFERERERGYGRG